ncbi:MAG TPA: prepilin peptidase [Ktedonobacterales bacterium]
MDTISMGLMLVATALAGVCLGAVVNALADRVVGDEEPPWSARQCRACRKPLAPAPRFGLLDLRRRRVCGQCGARASLRRPLLELALGLLLPALALHLVAAPGRLPLWAGFALDALALGALAFIFAVDLEHRLIFDLSLYLPIALLLGVTLAFDRKALMGMLFGALICGALFLLFYGLGFLLYHQEALGFGDVKLAVLVGLVAGWPGMMTALVVAALAGAGGSVLALGLGSASRTSYIPFGIFLALGAAAALLAAPPVW